MKLARAILFVKDLSAMTAFYRDGLGLAELPARAADGWVELDAGGASLGLHAIPAAIAAGITIASPPVAREGAAIKLAFEVADLDAARARALAAGARFAELTPWGTCDGADPEGNVFQLAAAR